jgi:hypothetical protein
MYKRGATHVQLIGCTGVCVQPATSAARAAPAIVVTGPGDIVANDAVCTLRVAIPAGFCPAGAPNTDTITIAASERRIHRQPNDNAGRDLARIRSQPP